MSTDKSKAARIADELEYKGQRGIDPWASELSEAVAELRRLSASEAALEAERDVLRAEVTRWSTTAAVIEAERNELRAEVQALIDALHSLLPNHPAHDVTEEQHNARVLIAKSMARKQQ